MARVLLRIRTVERRPIRERSADFQRGDNIRARAEASFAVRIVLFSQKLLDSPRAGRELAPQILNSGTALSPMLEEARAAESRRDFISKCSIGLKETREVLARLRVCVKSGVGPADEAASLAQEADELVAIMTTIVGNTRRNSKQRTPHARRRAKRGGHS